MRELVESLLFSTLEYAPPLVLAAQGAMLSERSGVVNIGVEGMMRVGAYAAAVLALTVPTPLGVVGGMVAGALVAAAHAYLCIRWRAEQVVSGMALNLVALAGVTFLLESFHGPGGTPPIEQLTRWSLPLLQDVPYLRALSGHSLLTPLSLCVALAMHGLMSRTPLGLRIRAVGEHPLAVATAGVSVQRLRYGCVVVSGLLAGLGGAALSTSTLNRFEHNMPAGMGFMAVAAMVFGRWTPLGTLGAALFFSAASALRIGLASSGSGWLEGIPGGVMLALPYVLTLVVLAFQRLRGGAPAALGTPYHSEAR